jgi:hypothetical protein
MTARVRIAAAALACALAACGDDEAQPQGLLLAEPNGAAPFHGLTGSDTTARPYLAIANAGTNDLTILDALTNRGVPAPFPLRTLVYPVPGRPVLLASARLGDGNDRPDLLVAVTAGDSRLQVIHTWDASGAIGDTVDLGGDVLAIVAVPSPAGRARIAAALSGRRIAVAEFIRVGTAAPYEIAPATTSVDPISTNPVQLVALAAIPGVEDRIWGATPDENGVAEIAIGPDGTPSYAGTILDAGGPTRLVAAARLAERGLGEGGLDPANWATTSPEPRVYAVLDESGCGPGTPTSCGLVALDPGTRTRALDFAEPPAIRQPREPLALRGSAVALAASGPPAVPPSTAAEDQKYAPPFMRLWPAPGPRPTTAVAAVASTDGAIYFVDLARWELPSDQAENSGLVHQNIGAAVSSVRAPATESGAVEQWLVLDPPGAGTVVAHTDPALSSAVRLTPGFTPSDRWTVTREGVLPGLSSRRAEAVSATSLALQVPGGGSEVVEVANPAVGIRAGLGEAGDLVVVTDPSAVGSCAATFEGRIVGFDAPATGSPGGALNVQPAEPRWADCFTGLPGKPNLRATVRAGGYVLVRGRDPSVVQIGRPELDVEFAVTTAVAPRISYVPERCVPVPPATTCAWTLPDPVGPALAFTLALETGAGEPRDMQLVIDTREGRTPFRALDPLGAAVGARGIAVWDPSPLSAGSGIRFLVPYGTNVVLDATPTQAGGGVAALR